MEDRYRNYKSFLSEGKECSKITLPDDFTGRQGLACYASYIFVKKYIPRTQKECQDLLNKEGIEEKVEDFCIQYYIELLSGNHIYVIDLLRKDAEHVFDIKNINKCDEKNIEERLKYIDKQDNLEVIDEYKILSYYCSERGNLKTCSMEHLSEYTCKKIGCYITFYTRDKCGLENIVGQLPDQLFQGENRYTIMPITIGIPAIFNKYIVCRVYVYVDLRKEFLKYFLEVKETKEEDSKKCFICYENDIDMLYIPCKHVLTCYSCQEKLKKHKCIYCNQDIREILHFM